MDWLERARCELRGNGNQPTAITAERIPTAVLAGSLLHKSQNLGFSNGSIGGVPRVMAPDIREWWEERAAIMEIDGGLGRNEAEQKAWAIVSARLRIH
jgi:hypothetical protein